MEHIIKVIISITLLYLVKGNTFKKTFFIKISRNKPISKFKKAIKAEKTPEFGNFPADKLKLWKVTIPDNRDDLLSNLTLNDGDELLATREIEDYWTEKPPKRHIHVLVSPPETTTSDEVLKLREEVASLKEKLSKNEYGSYFFHT